MVMKFIALKECNFDRHYYPGEMIDASAIDASIIKRAIGYGSIKKAEGAPLADAPVGEDQPDPNPERKPEETQAEDTPVKRADEPNEPVKRGRKGKGDA